MLPLQTEMKGFMSGPLAVRNSVGTSWTFSSKLTMPGMNLQVCR